MVKHVHLPSSAKYLTIISIAFSLFGCVATVPTTVKDPTALNEIQRIGVIVQIGDTLSYQRTGITVFGNKYEAFDVADWGLAKIWETQLKAELQSLNRFEVVNIDSDLSSLSDLYKLQFEFVAANSQDQNWANISEPLKAIALENNVDALLLLVGEPGVFGATKDQADGGFGIVAIGGPSPNSTYLFNGELALIDGGTGTPIAAQQVINNDSFWTAQYGGRPFRVAPKKFKDETLAAYSADEKDVLKQLFVDMPKTAWKLTLSKLIPPSEG